MSDELLFVIGLIIGILIGTPLLAAVLLEFLGEANG
jgi:hypothetical protein